MMQKCWDHEPDKRPSMSKVLQWAEAIELDSLHVDCCFDEVTNISTTYVDSTEPSFEDSHSDRSSTLKVEIEKSIKIVKDKVKSNADSVKRMEINIYSSFKDLEKANEQLKEDNNNLQHQFSVSQIQLLESINDLKTTVTHLQKNVAELKSHNSSLQNQLSLTQQHLLGVQSMVTCSRLWIILPHQFKIGKEIGRGAWATVHEATFRGATVAAKCLHKLIISPTTTQLFQREMEMALTCQHQNIVTFLGTTLEGPPVILMELMDTSLRSAYEKERVKDHQIHSILHDVAKALHFLHTRPNPVIHRDVSSANVLLKVLFNGEWLAKLGDLGTAKIQQQVATAGPGAIAYGAPEARNPEEHSPKMDVYSFGVVVIETLTKTHPFQKVDTLKAQVQQQYPQYHQLVSSCTKQQSSDRPTMYNVLVQLDEIAAAQDQL